jgi:hypothetical protein
MTIQMTSDVVNWYCYLGCHLAMSSGVVIWDDTLPILVIYWKLYSLWNIIWFCSLRYLLSENVCGKLLLFFVSVHSAMKTDVGVHETFVSSWTKAQNAKRWHPLQWKSMQIVLNLHRSLFFICIRTTSHFKINIRQKSCCDWSPVDFINECQRDNLKF